MSVRAFPSRLGPLYMPVTSNGGVVTGYALDNDFPSGGNRLRVIVDGMFNVKMDMPIMLYDSDSPPDPDYSGTGHRVIKIHSNGFTLFRDYDSEIDFDRWIQRPQHEVSIPQSTIITSDCSGYRYAEPVPFAIGKTKNWNDIIWHWRRCAEQQQPFDGYKAGDTIPLYRWADATYFGYSGIVNHEYWFHDFPRHIPAIWVPDFNFVVNLCNPAIVDDPDNVYCEVFSGVASDLVFDPGTKRFSGKMTYQDECAYPCSSDPDIWTSEMGFSLAPPGFAPDPPLITYTQGDCWYDPWDGISQQIFGPQRTWWSGWLGDKVLGRSGRAIFYDDNCDGEVDDWFDGRRWLASGVAGMKFVRVEVADESIIHFQYEEITSVEADSVC